MVSSLKLANPRHSYAPKWFLFSHLSYCDLHCHASVYVVATNLFGSLRRGCQAGLLVSFWADLRRRRTAHALTASPPALVDRPGATACCGRVRPRDPSAPAVPPHVSSRRARAPPATNRPPTGSHPH